jgi:hypothetical protein
MHQFIAKRNPGTLCWTTGENGEEIQIYISSKQVPKPMPAEIEVCICEDGENIENDATPGINLHLRRKAAGRHFIRFDPDGNPSSWPIGSLLLPQGILENSKSSALDLQINWH